MLKKVTWLRFYWRGEVVVKPGWKGRGRGERKECEVGIASGYFIQAAVRKRPLPGQENNLQICLIS